jgi:hypothetical protein
MSTPFSSRSFKSSRASGAVSAIGFSQSTCFFARAACLVSRHVQMIRQRIVDGVDLGVGEERFVRAVRARDAELGGRFLRLVDRTRADRDDLHELAFWIAGITFSTAIFATPRMPQRIFFMPAWLARLFARD